VVDAVVFLQDDVVFSFSADVDNGRYAIIK
jgi:hypothetical protein